jgi:hypothetical protein
MTPEQNFWRLIKPYVPGHAMRVENSACPGTFDVNGCWDGHEYWIELKVHGVKKPATEIRPWGLLNRSQRAWSFERNTEKGRLLLLVRCVNHIRLYRYFGHLFVRTTDEFIFYRPYNWGSFIRMLKKEILDETGHRF